MSVRKVQVLVGSPCLSLEWRSFRVFWDFKIQLNLLHAKCIASKVVLSNNSPPERTVVIFRECPMAVCFGLTSRKLLASQGLFFADNNSKFERPSNTRWCHENQSNQGYAMFSLQQDELQVGLLHSIKTQSQFVRTRKRMSAQARRQKISELECWCLKPLRGDLRTTATRFPGLGKGELLPVKIQPAEIVLIISGWNCFMMTCFLLVYASPSCYFT